MSLASRWLLTALCSVTLVGCQAGQNTEPSPGAVVSSHTPPTEVSTSADAPTAPAGDLAAAPTAAPTDAPTPVADPDAVQAQMVQTELHNDRVLTAAVMIVSAGDVDAAVRQGAFSEDELDAAFTAIQTGTLSRYAD